MTSGLRTLWVGAVAGVVLGLGGVGCGDDDEDKEKKAKGLAPSVRSQKPEVLKGAKKVTKADPRVGERVRLSPAAARTPEARRDLAKLTVRKAAPGFEGEAPSKAEYDRFVAAVLPEIDAYWREQTAKILPNAKYEPPAFLRAYHGANGPGCGGETGPHFAQNAYYCTTLVPPEQCTTPSTNRAYCSGNDIIAWDESGLMVPFFNRIGDLSVALVLAHEWGHLAQFRLFPEHKYRTTIRNELQADCYAGAWALDQERKGRVSVGDFNEALGLFYEIGGGEQAWLDEGSHGNKFQRTRTFVQGFEEDVQGCIGERFDRLLQRLGLGEEAAA